MAKGIIRTILDNHRDIAIFEAAANQYLSLLTIDNSLYYNVNNILLDSIGHSIISLKMKNKALEQEIERLKKVNNNEITKQETK